MIPVLVQQLLTTLHCLTDTTRHRVRTRTRDDAGGTLEVVILILGGMGIAALLVAALYQAVNSYIAKIK